MKVSFVIPTLNEEEGIGATLDAIDRDAFRARAWDLELLVVDGDSKDRTREEAEARGARVLIEPRKGYGRAYKTGFAAATGDVIVTGDADGTYPFEDAHQFVALLLEHGLDFLTCDRYADIGEGAMSAKHRLGNWVLSTTTRVLYRVRLRDSQSGMWIIRRTALAQLPIEALAEGMPFSQQLKIAALRDPAVRAAEVPGALRVRVGEAKIESWRDGFGNLGSLVRDRFRRR
jgi:dolichol-phosphate hexosyltransferase